MEPCCAKRPKQKLQFNQRELQFNQEESQFNQKGSQFYQRSVAIRVNLAALRFGQLVNVVDLSIHEGSMPNQTSSSKMEYVCGPLATAIVVSQS